MAAISSMCSRFVLAQGMALEGSRPDVYGLGLAWGLESAGKLFQAPGRDSLRMPGAGLDGGVGRRAVIRLPANGGQGR